ncbi:hypothetical protein IFR05_015416 [Cadophora sp. M221]|nr:hypothetical protein IFR05_015416 [Cadophora sp. M221]
MSVHAQSQRSRRRRPAESPEQNAFIAQGYGSQPHPALSPSHDANAAYVQQLGMEMNLFEPIDVELIMQSLMDGITPSAPLDGSLAQSPTNSWSNIEYPSPSVGMEEGTNSLVVVEHNYSRDLGSHAYSDNPNLALSVESDGDFVMFPIPENEIAGPWMLGAEYAVDTEAMEEDAHNPNYYLSSLSSAEPRTVHNPYEGWAVSNGEEPVSPDMQHYVYSVTQTQTAIAYPGAVKSPSDGPWSHVNPQMSGWEPGYVTYVPSPGPQGEADSEGSSSRASSEPHSPQMRKSRVEKSRSPQKASGKSGKAKRNPKELTWAYSGIGEDGLSFVSENKREEETHRNGVRTGKLKPEAAERAKRIRKLGACWPCWILKVPCSEGEICERCKKSKQAFMSPTADQLCCRQGFKDHVEVFFPTFLHSHLDQRKIEALVSKHTNGFRSITIVVEVSAGVVFKPMKLHANIFRRKTNKLLKQSRLMVGAHSNQNSELEVRDSLPIGIMGILPSRLNNKCSKYTDEMIASSDYAGQVSAGDQSRLAFRLLVAMQKYAKTEPIVHEALKLHAMHYFMGSLITFTPSSAQTIDENLQLLGYAPSNLDRFPSSRLLGRQIKEAMFKLQVETTTEVLASVEKSLRKRTTDHWAPSFATILIVCLCIENLESAIYTLVEMLRKDGKEGFGRTKSLEACMDLENGPFGQCKRLLHEIYRSNKESNGGARDGGFNPLRTFRNQQRTGLEGEAKKMVIEVAGVLNDNWSEVSNLAKRGPLSGLDYEVRPGDIRPYNTGRLASNFLISFFPDV